MDYQNALRSIQQTHPLIHCVSNIVSANDCANLLLAIGASPMMAQEAAEMEYIEAAAKAVVLNTGTPNDEKFRICTAAGCFANQNGIPVILDPVGIGASPYRLRRIEELLSTVHPSVIRANYGEACALLKRPAAEQGVDSAGSTGEQRKELALELAKRFSCTVLLSGTEDVISDGSQCVSVSGGSHWMLRITGAGCMLSVLCGAFAAAADTPFEGAVSAARFWKDTALKAETLSGGKGLGSYHMALFDAATQL